MLHFYILAVYYPVFSSVFWHFSAVNDCFYNLLPIVFYIFIFILLTNSSSSDRMNIVERVVSTDSKKFLSIKGQLIMSKNVGIVRRLDNLGRVTIPMEMRRTLGIENRGEVEISAQKNAIVIKKYEPVDVFTGSDKDLIEYEGKLVSVASIEALAKLAGLI